jgi:ABC-type transport system involved in multi-copper enzyme maturation permease subunit
MFEMLTTARRGRFYAIRSLYAVVLLLILWMIHSAWSADLDGELPVRVLPWFGLSAFGGIAVGQEILVLILTPALVAGAIADEKRRKTLHYLLASQLTGPEIVLGKLLVRMLYVGVLLGVSFPVMSLLVLMGGVDPKLVLVCCGALLSTAWFLATLSIGVSTIARRPREALFVTFGLELLWLVMPPVLKNGVSIGWSPANDALWWLADWVGASSPVYAFTEMFRTLVNGAATGFQETLLWMIGLQAAAGVVLALLAAILVRPIFKRQDGTVARPRGLRAILAARRLRSLRPLGERPMLWKELHTGRARGFARVVGWLLSLLLGGMLLYFSAWYGLMAFLESWDHGYGAAWVWGNHQSRWVFFYFLKLVLPLLYLLGILIIAGAAAASMTSEHEDDTWTSLTATDLTGWEIVLAKLFGSVWRARRLFSVAVVLVLAGIGAGSLHYLSLPSVILATAVYVWFAAALGVWISIQLRSTWRAQFLTIALLLLINVMGQGVINMLVPRGFAPQVWPGFTPYEIAKLVMEPPFFERFRFGIRPQFWRLWEVDDGPNWLATLGVMSLVGYASLAATLVWHAIRSFEAVAGRARRKRIGSVSPTEVAQLGRLANAQPS